MIVVVGQSGQSAGPAVARAAAAAGGTVELVTRVADDASGDRLLHALAAAGVGHVATLRQPAPATDLDPADLDLALRYLTDLTVIVLADPTTAGLMGVASEAAAWSRASLVAVVAAGGADLDALPDDAIILEAPGSDPDGAFHALVGGLAARLDAGVDPARAFADTMTGDARWTKVGD